jgi:cytochrome c biogenesis protein CcdA
MTGVAVSGYVSVAFGAGVATFFSPCAYALLPG